MSTTQEEKTENVSDVVQVALQSLETSKKKNSSWILGVIAAILGLIAIAIIYWRLRKQGKELAKLKHERDVAQEAQRQAKADALVAMNTTEVLQALENADASKERVSTLTQQISDLHTKQEEMHNTINQLTSWEDISEFLGESKVDE